MHTYTSDWSRTGLALILAMAVASVSASGGAQTAAPMCAITDEESHWIQQALDGWNQVTSEFLRLKPAPLPWMVLFDTSCVWHLGPGDQLVSDAASVKTSLAFAGQRVPVRVSPHGGRVQLPDGREVPAEPVASAGMYRDGAATFFVMALPEVWRRDPRHADMPNLDRFFQGVMTHEMVHTRHLVPILERIKEVARRYKLSSVHLDDDIIQTRFQRLRRFRNAFEAERDLFFQAAAESDPEKRRALTARGLSMTRQRRVRYFKGVDEMYAELEEIFLTMEGAGQWAAYRFAKAQAGPSLSDAAIIEFVRDNRKYWSQEEGLALFLLVDAMVPGWQGRVFGPEVASPLTLLEEAVRHGA